jgi:hypothetical protein
MREREYQLPASFDVDKFLADLRASDGAEDQEPHGFDKEAESVLPFPPPCRECEGYKDREDAAVVAAVCFGLMALGVVGLAVWRVLT